MRLGVAQTTSFLVSLVVSFASRICKLTVSALERKFGFSVAYPILRLDGEPSSCAIITYPAILYGHRFIPVNLL